MKSEGESYSIDDLMRDGTTVWEGVRNYQARNFMMRDMQVGDCVLFYHSNSAPSGVYGTAVVSALAHPDLSQGNKKDTMHYDAKATKEKPIWYCVDVSFVLKFPHPVSLAELKADHALLNMRVVQKASRLSVQPVSKAHFEHVCALGKK